ncbi:MAG TPA: transcriptional activator NhaR [Kofleriaceae bacterium]|jgi:LysR family transcriptional activator of nhaA|nr:transcriptional activator NhaR [Kofleriaceae bacterium]
MEWLNYHHLLYFWMVAKHGSITRASVELRLAHPTISGQIHQLEEALGAKLFVRSGRNLALTDSGRIAFRYADEIFALGQEFQDALKGRTTGQPLRLVVGVSDVIAKSIVHRILEPAFELRDKVRVICREARSADAFMGDLAVHAIDVVLADAPAGPGTPVRTFSHPLGECGSSFFATSQLARVSRQQFPRSLDGAPVILPGSDSTFRRALDEWFRSRNIHPQIVAELDDLALASVLAEKGLGVLAAPDVISKELRQRYSLQLVGRAKDLRQRFFAISMERKIKNPAVAAICEVARKKIFA